MKKLSALLLAFLTAASCCIGAAAAETGQTPAEVTSTSPETTTEAPAAAYSSVSAPDDGFDATQATEATEATESEETETQASESSFEDFKQMMDDYEAFMDSYCELMEKYNSDPGTYMKEYLEMNAKYLKVMDELEELEDEDLTDEEMAYYLEVMNRINTKLAEVAYQ